MATLEEALYGLNFSPAQTGYGIGQQALAQATPQLINPYGSTGQAIGISLGSILLQSLLGYQARSQAAQDTLQANTLANQMMSLSTPQARTDFIGGLEDPMQQSRLSTLATALTAQEAARKAKAADTLLGLETAADFELGPKGTELFNRKLLEEGRRQGAITAGFKERQDYYDQLMEDRRRRNKELGLEDVDIPAPIWTKAVEKNASSDLALDVAEAIDQYTSIPEFVASKGLSAFGDDQLKSRLRNLTTIVVQSRSGLAATDKERNNLNKILTGDFTAVDPKVVSGILKRFAQDERTIAADTVAAASQRPEAFVSELRQAITEGRKTNFSTRVPSYGAPAAATVEAPPVAAATQPKAQDKQSRLNDILNQIKQTTDPAKIAELKRQATAVMQGQ
jgi:hypothetical protein